MNCYMCKGLIEDKMSTHMVEVGECIIIIKNVPSHVCGQCGEVSYSFEIAKKLEKIVNDMKEIVSDVAVLDYRKLAS
ncbi:MAG: type II toxin-antitoxin system MqsA family antitoxin [Eubacteriales bacterium]